MKSLTIDDWTQSPALLPSLEVQGWGWKFQPSHQMIGSSGNEPSSGSYLEAHQESPHSHKLRYAWKRLVMNKKKCSFQEITRFLGALWQKLGTKTKCVFLMSQECYSFTAQPQMHNIVRKQPTPKGYEVYDSIYDNILEKAKQQGHKIDQWLSRSGVWERGLDYQRAQDNIYIFVVMVVTQIQVLTKTHKTI